MIFLALLLLTADPRQTVHEERQLGVCPVESVARALPQSSLCWDHVPRGVAEIPVPGGGGVMTVEYGVDAYRVYEDGVFRSQLDCGVVSYLRADGVTEVLWMCPVSFSPLKLTAHPWTPGDSHDWCVTSVTGDIFFGEQTESAEPTCLAVEIESICPAHFEGDSSECLLTVLP